MMSIFGCDMEYTVGMDATSLGCIRRPQGGRWVFGRSWKRWHLEKDGCEFLRVHKLRVYSGMMTRWFSDEERDLADWFEQNPSIDETNKLKRNPTGWENCSRRRSLVLQRGYRSVLEQPPGSFWSPTCFRGRWGIRGDGSGKRFVRASQALQTFRIGVIKALGFLLW